MIWALLCHSFYYVTAALGHSVLQMLSHTGSAPGGMLGWKRTGTESPRGCLTETKRGCLLPADSTAVAMTFWRVGRRRAGSHQIAKQPTKRTVQFYSRFPSLYCCDQEELEHVPLLLTENQPRRGNISVAAWSPLQARICLQQNPSDYDTGTRNRMKYKALVCSKCPLHSDMAETSKRRQVGTCFCHYSTAFSLTLGIILFFPGSNA